MQAAGASNLVKLDEILIVLVLCELQSDPTKEVNHIKPSYGEIGEEVTYLVNLWGINIGSASGWDHFSTV